MPVFAVFLGVSRLWDVGGKTASVRSMPMADQVAAALDGLSRRDRFVGDDDFVFCTPLGEPRSDYFIRGAFYEALVRAGLGHLRTKEHPIRFHDLRHTFGTLAVQAAPAQHHNIFVVIRYPHYAVIPEFDDSGNLPPGVHEATWDEVVERFGRNARRRLLLEGLKLALEDLKAAGCETVYVDGSFVSANEVPRDFDACWVADGVNSDDLHPALLKLKIPRSAQKARYGGELVISDGLSEPFGPRYLDFFQQDGRTGEAKGIIKINLKELQ